MLLAIIEEKEKNRYSEIHLDEKDNRILGFSLVGNVLSPLTEETLNHLDCFKLGAKNKKIGEKNGFEVFLDEATNFVHFLKDDMPNYELFFEMNGVDCTAYDQVIPHYTGRKKYDFKKFLVKGISIACSTVALTIGLGVISLYPTAISGARVSLNDTLVYLLGDDDRKFDAITAQDIKNYIFETPGLPDEVKTFLWNEELIEDVLQYYEGTPLEFISRIRHHNLALFPEMNPNRGGHYCFGNALYSQYPNDEPFNKNEYRAIIPAHEYAHLLQANGFPFILETEAELVAREYYMDISENNGSFAYIIPCRYLKILMEIIGPEPIKDNAHRTNSTAIQDAVRPYFNDTEYADFIAILETTPADEEKMESLYERFDELLNILHFNKFGKPIEENIMITAIRNDYEYESFYLKESSIQNEQARCTAGWSLPVQEAVNKGMVAFFKEETISQEQMNDDSLIAKDKYLQIAIHGTPCIINIGSCRFKRFVTYPDDCCVMGNHESIMMSANHNNSLSFIEDKDNNTMTINIQKVIDVPAPEDYLSLTIDSDNNIVSLKLSDGTEIPRDEYKDYMSIAYIATVPIGFDEYTENKSKSFTKYFLEGHAGIIIDGNFEYTEDIDLPPITERIESNYTKTTTF